MICFWVIKSWYVILIVNVLKSFKDHDLEWNKRLRVHSTVGYPQLQGWRNFPFYLPECFNPITQNGHFPCPGKQIITPFFFVMNIQQACFFVIQYYIGCIKPLPQWITQAGSPCKDKCFSTGYAHEETESFSNYIFLNALGARHLPSPLVCFSQLPHTFGPVEPWWVGCLPLWQFFFFKRKSPQLHHFVQVADAFIKDQAVLRDNKPRN